MRALLAGVLVLGALASVAAEEDPAGPVQLRYEFGEGDRTRFRIDYRYDIDESRQGQRRGGTIKQGFQYLQEVARVKSDSGTATVKISFEECSFDGGDPRAAFDSSNPDHRSAAKSNPAFALWGAVLTTRVRARLTTKGVVEFFRVTEIDKDYPEQVAEMAKAVVEQNAAYWVLPLPDKELTPGGSWKAQLPVKFFGGPLNKKTIHIDGRFTLEGVEIFNGERRARITIALEQQPALGLSQDSLQGAEVDLKVTKLTGSMVFSLEHGNIVNYDVSVGTHLKLGFQGQSLGEHTMTYRFTLKRLP